MLVDTPALTLKVPDVVVIPVRSTISPDVLIPVNDEPSPLNDVAVSIPVTIAPELVVSNFFASLWYKLTCPSL